MVGLYQRNFSKSNAKRSTGPGQTKVRLNLWELGNSLQPPPFEGQLSNPLYWLCVLRKALVFSKIHNFQGSFLRFAERSLSDICRRLSRCSSAVFQKKMQSSRWGTVFLYVNSSETYYNTLWNVFGLPVRPIGIRSYLRDPNVVLKAVKSGFLISMGIW